MFLSSVGPRRPADISDPRTHFPNDYIDVAKRY